MRYLHHVSCCDFVRRLVNCLCRDDIVLSCVYTCLLVDIYLYYNYEYITAVTNIYASDII